MTRGDGSSPRSASRLCNSATLSGPPETPTTTPAPARPRRRRERLTFSGRTADVLTAWLRLMACPGTLPARGRLLRGAGVQVAQHPRGRLEQGGVARLTAEPLQRQAD